MTKFREYILKSGNEILLGKNAESNDELMKLYRGKENTIFHTIAPGSPFCVIDNLNPTQKEIQESAIICAAKSQDWRDNKNDVKVNLFKGKDIKKTILMKTGSWKIKSKPEILKKLNSRPHSVIEKNNLSSVKSLGKNFTARIIGFTIILRKWRKARE